MDSKYLEWRRMRLEREQASISAAEAESAAAAAIIVGSRDPPSVHYVDVDGDGDIDGDNDEDAPLLKNDDDTAQSLPLPQQKQQQRPQPQQQQRPQQEPQVQPGPEQHQQLQVPQKLQQLQVPQQQQQRPQPRQQPSFYKIVVDSWATALKSWYAGVIMRTMHYSPHRITPTHHQNMTYHQRRQQQASHIVATFNALIDNTLDTTLVQTITDSGLPAEQIQLHVLNLLRTHWYIWNYTGSTDWVEPMFAPDGGFHPDAHRHMSVGVSSLMSQRCTFVYDRTASAPLAVWLEAERWSHYNKHFPNGATLNTLLTLVNAGVQLGGNDDVDHTVGPGHTGVDRTKQNNIGVEPMTAPMASHPIALPHHPNPMWKHFMRDCGELVDARHQASKPGFNLGVDCYIHSLRFAAQVYALFMSPSLPEEFTTPLDIVTNPITGAVMGAGECLYGVGGLTDPNHTPFDDISLQPPLRLFLTFRLFTEVARLRFMPVILALAIHYQFAPRWAEYCDRPNIDVGQDNIDQRSYQVPIFTLFAHSLLYTLYPHLNAYVKLVVKMSHVGDEVDTETMEPVYAASRALMSAKPRTEARIRSTHILSVLEGLVDTLANDYNCETHLSSCNHGHSLCGHDFDRRILSIGRMHYICTTQRGQSNLMTPRLDSKSEPRFTWSSLSRIVTDPSAMELRWSQFVRAAANTNYSPIPQLKHVPRQVHAHFNRWLVKVEFWSPLEPWASHSSADQLGDLRDDEDGLCCMHPQSPNRIDLFRRILAESDGIASS